MSISDFIISFIGFIKRSGTIIGYNGAYCCVKRSGTSIGYNGAYCFVKRSGTSIGYNGASLFFYSVQL